MRDNNNLGHIEPKLSSSRSSSLDPAEILLSSLIASAQKLEASSIHIYSSPKARTCYFEVAGKLQTTGKKFNSKILEELIDFIKTSSNLGESELTQVQTAKLEVHGLADSNLTYIQNPELKTSHLILPLNTGIKPKAFEDLGFWGKSLEQLESALDSKKGIIVIDSTDQYALRSTINSCLSYLRQDHKIASVSLDSSQIPDTNLRNHDRIFTKLDSTTSPLARQILSSSPPAIAFLDPLNSATLELATEQATLGKLVFVASLEGSVAGALKKMMSVSSGSLQEVKLVISTSPIQTIASSNGTHPLDVGVIAQIENFFGLYLPESWKSIYAHAGIITPEELLHLNFPLASEYGSLTNLIEVFNPAEEVTRIIQKNPDLTTLALNQLAIRSGMLTKREDGLIKALQKQVDLADVIEACK